MSIIHYDHRDKNIPLFLIIGLDSELRAFKSIVDNLNLPTIDLDACLQQIFDLISLSGSRDELIKMLNNMADWMSGGEGLYENARLDYYEKGLIFNSIMELGIAVLIKINNLNLYIDGYCPYSFYKMHGNNAVMLRYHDENF